MPRGRGKNRMRLVKAPPTSTAEANLIEEVRSYLDRDADNPMVGYVVAAVYRSGHVSRGCYYPSDVDRFVGDIAFRALIKEAVSSVLNRRQAEHAAHDVLDDRTIDQ